MGYCISPFVLISICVGFVLQTCGPANMSLSCGKGLRDITQWICPTCGLSPGPCAGVDYIDAVITWVNTTDPDWIKGARAAGLHVGEDGGRDSDPFDALKFNLRSINRNAKWIRNIFIVSTGQVPLWLNMSYGRVHVIPHSRITSDNRTLYCGYHSEAHLGNLPPVVSACFLKFDDDFLIMKPTSRDTFFPNGYMAPHFAVHDKLATFGRDPHTPYPLNAGMFRAWCQNSSACQNNRDPRSGSPVCKKEQIMSHVEEQTSIQSLHGTQIYGDDGFFINMLPLGGNFLPKLGDRMNTYLAYLLIKMIRPMFLHIPSGQAETTSDVWTSFIRTFLSDEFEEEAPWELSHRQS